jgi:transcriptional regulator with XRE-family HTH domain
MEPLRLSQMHVDTPSHNTTLGPALRAARKARGLSLNEVAATTRISRSLLSLIETGRSDITVGRLGRLAQLYELRVADLVPEPRRPDPIVVRSDDRQVLHYTAEGIDVEVLAPQGPKTMQAFLATFLPDAAMEDFIVQENEQFVHMLEGRVRTEFGDGREIELSAGDSAYYVSGEGGHRHTNLADGVTRMVIVLVRRRP